MCSTVDSIQQQASLDLIICTHNLISTLPGGTNASQFEYTITWINQYTLIPIICIAGVVGNIISGVVVVRSGVRKPSNIFLLGLAISDALTLLHVLNVLDYMYLTDKRTYDDHKIYLKYQSALSLMIWYVVTLVIGGFATRMSTTIVVIIAVERLVAVFFPLRFPQMVTSKRAWLALACGMSFWLPWTVYQFFWFQFNFVDSGHGDLYYAWESLSGYYSSESFDAASFNNFVVSHLTHTIPLIIVAVGSIAIGVKVGIVSKRRQKIVSGAGRQRITSRTTLTLLMVCGIFSFSRFCFVIRQLQWFDYDNPTWNTVAIVYEITRSRLIEINSASNFFIYVVINPKFRHIMRDMFLGRRREEKITTSSVDSVALY